MALSVLFGGYVASVTHFWIHSQLVGPPPFDLGHPQRPFLLLYSLLLPNSHCSCRVSFFVSQPCLRQPLLPVNLRCRVLQVHVGAFQAICQFEISGLVPMSTGQYSVDAAPDFVYWVKSHGGVGRRRHVRGHRCRASG